jgi:FkbM family methyltransferase
MERHVYFLGWHWERDVQLLIDAILEPGDTFIDVGANIGLVSLHAARCVEPNGRVIAFEPQKPCYTRLVQTIRMNNITSIEAHNLGLAEHVMVQREMEFPRVGDKYQIHECL